MSLAKEADANTHVSWATLGRMIRDQQLRREQEEAQQRELVAAAEQAAADRREQVAAFVAVCARALRQSAVEVRFGPARHGTKPWGSLSHVVMPISMA